MRIRIHNTEFIILLSFSRKIFPGEELTYDYKFPIEDVKLKCHCGARKCKKYMN
jgi:SET domain-containing protein